MPILQEWTGVRPFTPTVQTSHVMVSRRRRWAPLIPIRDNGDLQDGQMC